MGTKARNIMKSLRVKDFLTARIIGGDATNNAATSGALAVSVEEIYSGYTTNASANIAATLADGFEGQIKIIKLETFDTSDLVVTPANFADGTTITFDATGEVAILLFDGTNWQEIYTDATVA